MQFVPVHRVAARRAHAAPSALLPSSRSSTARCSCATASPPRAAVSSRAASPPVGASASHQTATVPEGPLCVRLLPALPAPRLSVPACRCGPAWPGSGSGPGVHLRPSGPPSVVHFISLYFPRRRFFAACQLALHVLLAFVCPLRDPLVSLLLSGRSHACTCCLRCIAYLPRLIFGVPPRGVGDSNHRIRRLPPVYDHHDQYQQRRHEPCSPAHDLHLPAASTGGWALWRRSWVRRYGGWGVWLWLWGGRWPR